MTVLQCLQVGCRLMKCQMQNASNHSVGRSSNVFYRYHKCSSILRFKLSWYYQDILGWLLKLKGHTHACAHLLEGISVAKNWPMQSLDHEGSISLGQSTSKQVTLDEKGLRSLELKKSCTVYTSEVLCTSIFE